MRNTSVTGMGYLSLVTSACLAELGHEATPLGIGPRRLRVEERSMLSVSEPDLPELWQRTWVVGTREIGSTGVELDSDSL